MARKAMRAAKPLGWMALGGAITATWMLGPRVAVNRALDAGYSLAGWFGSFLPRLAEGQPRSLFEPAFVSDRSDGKIVHLDGTNLSRAWCWRGIADALEPELADLARRTADAHLDSSLPHVAGDYMGEHWLATFALLALEQEI